MGKPARDAVYACDVKDMGQRLILLILADFSPSEKSPFEAWPGVSRLARCANRSRSQIHRILKSLKAEGVIESYQINRYQWGYRILLPDADVAVDDTPQHADVAVDAIPPFSDVAVDDTPQSQDVAYDAIPEYPYGVASTSRGVASTSRGVASTSRGVASTSRGVASTSLLLRNEREERREREENEGDARTRDPISPSLVMSADQAFRVILDYLEGEVSDHERRTWRERVRAGWAAPDMLCLRGPASLVRLPRFTGSVRMAAKELGMRAVVEFRTIGA